MQRHPNEETAKASLMEVSKQRHSSSMRVTTVTSITGFIYKKLFPHSGGKGTLHTLAELGFFLTLYLFHIGTMSHEDIEKFHANKGTSLIQCPT